MEKNINEQIEVLKKELAKLEEIANAKEIKHEQARKLFIDLVFNSNLKQVYDMENNRITWYDSNNIWVIEQNNKNMYIWFSYNRFWSKFESIFGSNYQEIKLFLSGMVEETIGLKGFTTGFCVGCIVPSVEETIGLKGFTTRHEILYKKQKVEETIGLKGFTTNWFS